MSIEGQQLNGGRYHLLSLLSRSNTSEVYLAEDTQLSHQVAIKIILPETSAYPGADATVFGSRLFIREVEIIKTFNHPHILPLLDYGNEPVSGMMLTYLVMPFCPDGSFAAWLRQHSSLLPPKDVVEIVRQVADALKYAHDHQILHLSIKPSNFLMQSCGENKHRPDLLLTNFKMVKSNSAPAGAGRTIDSNPSYMAPEQWHGSPVPATDQYALAVVAYELITGHPPFQGTSEQLREQHLNAQPQPPSTINSRLPKAVDEVILHALAKKPADRFISVTAFAYAFGQAMQNSAMSANAHKLTEPKQVAPPKITPGIVVSPGTYPAGIETSKKRIIPSNMKANILLYCALTGAICFIVGIMLNTLGILPPLVANIASSIGAAIAFIAGSWGFLQKLFPMNVWLNARKLPVVSFSLVTVVIITVAALYLSSLNAVPTDPYVHHGTLQFEDPLLDNSQGHNWYTGPQSNNHQDIGACMFKNGAYHAIESSSSPFFVSCRDTADNFSDFVFEVQMKIIQGDFGGIVFRYNTNTSDAYYVEFNQRGEYFLSLKTGTKHILASGNPASIHTGLNQSNLIAVVAQGNTISLFANNQHLATVLGNSLSVGQIALIAYNGGSPTEVEYSNAKLWAL